MSLLALWPRAAVAATPTLVEVVKVEGAIDRPLLGYLNDRLDAAERSGAIVVLQIDTSGTLDQDGVAFAQRVADLSVPVIAWVGPVPARASGAGLLLMYASSLAGSRPGSQTGPLHPIDLSRPDDRPPGLHDTIAGWIAARDKDTDIDWIDRPLTAAEARDLDIAQVAATSIPELLDTIDGRTVQTPGGPVALHTKIATTETEATKGPSTSASRTSGRSTACSTASRHRRWCISCWSWRSRARIRAHPAGVRIRRVRGAGHARARPRTG